MLDHPWNSVDAPAMPRVAVVTESTACLPATMVRDYQIGVIPIPFSFGDETFLDGQTITAEEFYERLVTSPTTPKTSPPSPGEYLTAWRTAAIGRDAVVQVTVDSKVSTLQRSALLACDLAREAMPNTPISIVDSLSAGMGQGFVALAAARAARAGRSLTEVVATAESVSRRVRLLVTLDTLEYLARNARLPQVAAWVGGILAIKPIVQISGGDIGMLERVRTRRRALEALFEQVRRSIPDGARVHAAVQHARAFDEALRFETRLRDAFDCTELFTTEFTPIMGSYCGPGLLGAAFYAEDRHDSL